MAITHVSLGPRQKNKRRAVPYNAYIQHQRQHKYYERKKTLNKFKRLQKYEDKQQRQYIASEGANSEKGSTFLEKLLSEGVDNLSSEYEKRLEHSFGSKASLDTSKRQVKKKKKRKASTLADSRSDGEFRANEVHIAPTRSRRKNSNAKVNAPTEELARFASVDDRAKKDREHTPPRKKDLHKRKLDRKAHKESGKVVGRGNAAPVPNRYVKELREYQKSKEAIQAERQKKQEEIRVRNRRKREIAKGRAVKGEMLAQRNSRGQPKMQNILAGLTAKLVGSPNT